MIQVKLTGLSVEQVRSIAVVLSKQRQDIPERGAGIAPHWAPTVHCDGPEKFSVFTPTIPAGVAKAVLEAL